MKNRIIRWLFYPLVLLTLSAGARQDFPKTPAGEQLKALLAAFEIRAGRRGGDEELREISAFDAQLLLSSLVWRLGPGALGGLPHEGLLKG